ncbi:hypothetical protein [Cellulosimicrobium sp. Marseille-Q4280]|nr:hypothetical protein [Cellulosimicrobium sp. Marseille-Q4280]
MARNNKDRFDFAGAEDNVGSWLGNTGRVVIPIILGVVVLFGIVLEFV